MRMALGEQMGPSRRELIRVPLGERAYEIAVGRGVIGEAGERIAALGARSVGLVTDENVDRHHAAGVVADLERRGVRVAKVVVPAGEATKSFEHVERTCDAFLSARLERGDTVLALGGGVVGDLAGFTAAILLRGIRLVQAPTTLLSQVDSSVGGKTGINTPRGKNLIGAFHQPSLVLADTALLDTLSEREMRAGYAEVAKYGLINDPGFFRWCEGHWREVFSGGPERDRAVAQSCRAKAAIVVRDEREEGDRALLNLGHTFGHALERAVSFDGGRLVHGEAVAIGMALAFRFSARLGLAPVADAERMAAHLSTVGLPTRISEVPGSEAFSADELLSAMGQDKKVTAGRLTFILVRGIGKAFLTREIEPAEVSAFLKAELVQKSV